MNVTKNELIEIVDEIDDVEIVENSNKKYLTLKVIGSFSFLKDEYLKKYNVEIDDDDIIDIIRTNNIYYGINEFIVILKIDEFDELYELLNDYELKLIDVKYLSSSTILINYENEINDEFIEMLDDELNDILNIKNVEIYDDEILIDLN